MAFKVFISHASQDKQFIEEQIIPCLHKSGIDTWYSSREILPAAQWQAQIRHGLEECDWFLVALSNESVCSDWVKTEVAWAFELKPRKIIPIVIDDCDPCDCHMQLKMIQHIDWSQDKDKANVQLSSVFSENGNEDEGGLSDNEREVIQKLRDLRKLPDLQELPFLFRCLCFENKGIRDRSLQVLQKIGWQEIKFAMSNIVKSSDRTTIDDILNGLALVEANTKTINVLLSLCEVLTGDQRNRAIALLGRKRLSLQLNEVSKLFTDHHLPYDLIKVLGQGVFTASYLARHKQSGQEVVVRILSPECAIEDSIRTQFVELTSRSMRYVHETLALTREVNRFSESNLYYCIRDYIQGTELQKVLNSGKIFDAAQVIDILRQIASALTPIHARSEVHNGIKPYNIFVNDDGVILGDPALSVTLVRPALKRLSYDYQYTSPETFQSNNNLSSGSDYYSLGCVAYELLCGKPPFVSDDVFELAYKHINSCIELPTSRCKSIHPAWDVFIMALLEKDVHMRPKSVAKIISMIDTLFEDVFKSEYSFSAIEPILSDAERCDILTDQTLFTLPSEEEFDVDHTVFFNKPNIEIVDTVNTDRTGKNKVGTVLKDRFELVSIIGRGGMGTVYKALDRRDIEAGNSSFIAIKIINEKYQSDANLIKNLYSETRKTQSLAHPNIVTVYDFDRDGDTIFMTMEYLEGISLKRYIHNFEKCETSEPDAFEFISGIGSALSYAHKKNIIHSDLKPGNVFIEKNNQIKVLDFGISRVIEQTLEEKDMTMFDAGNLGGNTPAYASLEILNEIDPDPADDVYALACIFYELLTGKHPFGRVSALQARQNNLKPEKIGSLSSAQWKGLLKGLVFERKNRTQTVELFLNDIQQPQKFSLRRFFLG
jgi:serine/threonine protein kinase